MKLSFEEAAAEAVARWVSNTVKPGKHCRKFNLPMLDFRRLFKVLKSQLESDSSHFSFCAAGFDIDEPSLLSLAKSEGLNFKNVASHLQKAALWRNNDDTTIIALSRGEPEGGNTLAEFSTSSSSDIARCLLLWISDPEHFFSSTVNAPDFHGRLLNLIATDPPTNLILSLDAVSRFAAKWAESRSDEDSQIKNDAPLLALSELMIGFDSDLVIIKGDSEDKKKESLKENLSASIATTQEILGLQEKELKELDSKIQRLDATNRPLFNNLIPSIREAQRSGIPDNLRNLKLHLFRKLQKIKLRGDSPPPTQAALDWADVEKFIISCLLSDHQQSCIDLYSAIISCEPEQGTRDLRFDFGNGEELLVLPVIRPECEALSLFASPDILGGAVHFHHQQNTSSLLRQLSAATRKYFLNFDARIFQDEQSGKTYNLNQLLDEWDNFPFFKSLKGPTLVSLWENWMTARNALLTHQEFLFLCPITLLAGNNEVLKNTKALIEASASIFEKLASLRNEMLSAWRPGAEALFDFLLAVDTVQIRVLSQKPGHTANRLVFLSTHPIFLWRSYTFVTKCLEAKCDKDEKAREAIYSSLRRPDLFLPAWYASRLPENDGAAKILPFAGIISGLAVFQNLENVVASIEGIDDVKNALVRFSAIYPEFCRPLRITVINPPDPEDLLPALAKCLEEPKGPDRLEIRFLATSRMQARLADAQRLYLATGGELGDSIDSGQLSLEVTTYSDEAIKLNFLIETLKSTPSHIIVMFDEAELEIDPRTQTRSFPMSPFTVVHDLKKAGPPSSPRLELEPVNSEPLFTGTQRLIISAHGNNGDSLNASIRATNYIESLNNALKNESPAALWVIIADRQLPNTALLNAQLLHKSIGRIREVGVYCQDLLWLARRVKSAFRDCNLDYRASDLERLLKDGNSLLSGGLLELVQARDGKPNQTFVQGLAGTLFVARAWKQEHPEGLLISADSDTARSWLGLGTSSIRSDLIGLYKKDGQYVFEIIEVKTSHDLISEETKLEAIQQVEATLSATSHGLIGSDVLATPRREMLKEVLKQGIEDAPFEFEETKKTEHQKQWIDWIMEIFGESKISFGFLGRVFCVQLRDRSPFPPESRKTDKWSILLQCIGEEDCLQLGLRNLTSRRQDSESLTEGSLLSRQTEIGSQAISAPDISENRSDGPSKKQNKPSDNHERNRKEQSSAAENGIPAIYLGDKSTKDQVFWRPFLKTAPLNNPHTVVVGGSGSGKTETLKVFLHELNRQGIACIVFDFKDDYVNHDFTKAINAKIHLVEGGLPLNPMIPGVDPLTGFINLTNHVFNISGILAKVYGLGDQQEVSLRNAFFTVYENAGFQRASSSPNPDLKVPSFLDVRPILEGFEADALINRLSPIFDLNLFPENHFPIKSFFSGVHVVRFTQLPNEEVKKACAEILLMGCYNEMLRLGHSKSLRLSFFVDEAHRIANLSTVGLLLREARAYGVSVFLSSQQARDFSDTVYSNADTLIGLKLNEPRDAERLGALLAGTPKAKEMAESIRALRPGQAFLKNNQFSPYVKFQIKRISDRSLI